MRVNLHGMEQRGRRDLNNRIERTDNREVLPPRIGPVAQRLFGNAMPGHAALVGEVDVMPSERWRRLATKAQAHQRSILANQIHETPINTVAVMTPFPLQSYTAKLISFKQSAIRKLNELKGNRKEALPTHILDSSRIGEAGLAMDFVQALEMTRTPEAYLKIIVRYGASFVLTVPQADQLATVVGERTRVNLEHIRDIIRRFWLDAHPQALLQMDLSQALHLIPTTNSSNTIGNQMLDIVREYNEQVALAKQMRDRDRRNQYSKSRFTVDDSEASVFILP